MSASTDEVVADVKVRDSVARQLRAFCYDKVAPAALMDADLPRLPIRGICDYSDSHAGKEWRAYAAAAAAAYARQLTQEMDLILSGEILKPERSSSKLRRYYHDQARY